jgi:Tn3 transposase DDE domain
MSYSGCSAYWNTIYVEAALNRLRLEGHQVWEADVARLSPLIHDHINMLGRYSFRDPENGSAGRTAAIAQSGC